MAFSCSPPPLPLFDKIYCKVFQKFLTKISDFICNESAINLFWMGNDPLLKCLPKIIHFLWGQGSFKGGPFLLHIFRRGQGAKEESWRIRWNLEVQIVFVLFQSSSLLAFSFAHFPFRKDGGRTAHLPSFCH